MANPATFTAMDATLRAAQDHFDRRLFAIEADIRSTLAGRKPSSLSGADAVRFKKLKAEFEAVANEPKHFAEADLTARLRHGEGGAPVDA